LRSHAALLEPADRVVKAVITPEHLLPTAKVEEPKTPSAFASSVAAAYFLAISSVAASWITRTGSCPTSLRLLLRFGSDPAGSRSSNQRR
jgi:hypothetical protein